MTIVEFLKARFYEERLALHAATGHRWEINARSFRGGQEWLVVSAEGAGPPPPAIGIPSEGNAEHIARWDPERAQREIDAKWELLSRFQAMRDGVLVVTGAESILSEYRRVILPALALPYVDHPDYQQEWAP